MKKFLINDFEGPLDLLLHLVKKSKMDINDINLEELTNQYVSYINEMEELNLDVASEYLVMAAELIEMKSRKLLPTSEEENTDEEIFSEEELKRRLKEYERYKNSTPIFKDLEKNRNQYFTKLPEDIKNYTKECVESDGSVTVDDLVKAIEEILLRQKYSKPIKTKITKKELSIRDRVVKIRSILKKQKKVEFVELFDNYTKAYVVVTFLGILEMAKDKEIIITQKNNFDKIYLELARN